MIVRQVWYLWDLFYHLLVALWFFFLSKQRFFFLQVVLKKLNTSYQTHQILERSCYKYIIIPDVLNTLYLNIFYNNFFLQSIHREIRHTWKMRIFDIFAFFGLKGIQLTFFKSIIMTRQNLEREQKCGGSRSWLGIFRGSQISILFFPKKDFFFLV